MKILSLFDGMSVAQQALKESGFTIEKYYASEVDQYAIATTQSNHPETIQLGSVVGLELNDDIDLLIGGSPCQDLSIAKSNRKGLDGERSGLFWEYLRIRDEIKPRFFILENVASMPKEAKEEISKALGVEPVMINAGLVSAQNRKRLFWVGQLDEFRTYKQVDITQPDDMGIFLKDVLEEEVDDIYTVKNINLFRTNTKSTGSLDFIGGIKNKDWVGDGKKLSRNFPQGDRVYSPEGKAATLSANGGGRGAKTGLYEVSGAASRTYPRTKTIGVKREKRIEIRDDGKANSMTSVQGDSMVSEGTRIRKLTPVECLRLQSMPDTYFDKAEIRNKPISNTQRYKMCGNAFNKEVVIHILKQLDL